MVMAASVPGVGVAQSDAVPPELRLTDGLVVAVFALERDLPPQNEMFAPADGMQYVAALVAIGAPEGLATGPRSWSYADLSARADGVVFPPAAAYADLSDRATFMISMSVRGSGLPRPRSFSLKKAVLDRPSVTSANRTPLAQ